MVLKSSTGEREVPVGEFLVDTFQTLDRLERAAHRDPRAGAAAKAAARTSSWNARWATTRPSAAAIYLELNDGSIGKAGIALTSVGLTNIKATAAEASLVGAAGGEGVFAEAGRLAAEATNPVADVRGSAEYKRHMVEIYVQRGLASAFEMAGAA